MQLPEQMKAIEIIRPGGPEVLVPCTRAVPEPRSGQVLIRVVAAGVNRPDVLQRSGLYNPPPNASDLPGLEVAGTIVRGDTSGSMFQMGDAVCALVSGGGYAEYCVADIGQCLPIPNGWSMIEAASLPETCFTVWSNVFDRARLVEGDSVLVQGGSSGIGVTAIQILRGLGHTIFATAGSAEKVAACEKLGAERAMNYREQDFVAEVKAATSGRGVDVILDMVGGPYLQKNINCLADDGRLIIIGVLGGSRGEVALSQVLLRRLTVTGSTLRPRSIEYKARVAKELLANVWPLANARRLQPVLHATLPFEQAAEAHRLMESGEHIGKLMLTVISE